MITEEQDDYTPFGPEWVKEMNKFGKTQLILILRGHLMTADRFKPKWISVEDVLPDEEISVLAFDENDKIKCVRKAIIRNGVWQEVGYAFDFTATHWMPLPDLP